MSTQQAVVEVNPSRIAYIEECTSCKVRRAVLIDKGQSEDPVNLPPGFPVPDDIKIEILVPRWCRSCNDNTRFIDK